jgi:FKBP-type peptidyl-prolyl cis-trans isomerase SlyD
MIVDHVIPRRIRLRRNPVTIAKDRVVSIDYTLTNDKGEVLDTSQGRAPLEYLHGAGNLISGLETALAGQSPGDQMNVTVQPAEGYGDRDEGLVANVGREAFQGIEELQVGMRFQADTSQGTRLFTVTEIEGDQVKIDGNHPLAGEVLNFDVTVRDVREATETELEHGHAHGPGVADH